MRLAISKKNQSTLLAILVVAGFTVPIFGFFVASGISPSHQLLHSSNGTKFWVASSAQKVGRQAIPSRYTSNDTLHVSLAKNEYEAVQVVVLPRKHVAIMSLTASDLTHVLFPSEIIGNGNITWNPVEYVLNDTYPDRLALQEPFHATARVNTPIWFQIHAPSNVTAGTYRGTVQINGPGFNAANFTLEVEVWNFTLPEVGHLDSFFNPSIDPRNGDDLDLFNNMREHRAMTAGLDMGFTTENATGQLEFNFTDWDVQFQYMLDRGQRAFMVGLPDRGGEGHPEFGAAYNESAVRNYEKLYTHLEAKNWTQYCYVYQIDEPSIHECYAIEKHCQLLHQGAPTLRTLVTAEPSEEISFLFDDIDIWCPMPNGYDKSIVQYMKETWECEFWSYVCLFPKSPYANIQAYNPAMDGRLLTGFHSWAYDLDGFLYWHTLFHYYGNFGLGFNGFLDGWLLYPQEDGTGHLNSTRWELLRDGFEDYEYLWMLNHTLHHNASTLPPSTEAEIEGIFDNVHALLPDPNEFEHDYIPYMNLREQIAQILLGM